MAPKKKKSAKTRGLDQETGKESEAEAELHREYETLTETLKHLKRRAEQLRRDNEFLQIEVNQTRVEGEEYTSYISKRLQKSKSAMLTLSDHSQQELEELRRQRVEMQEQHEEQASGLKNELSEKESELALLNLEISELREFKEQQLAQITELEREVEAARCLRAESGQVLKTDFLTQKEHYDAQAKHKIQELTLAVNMEASRCLQDEIRQVREDNQRLREELRRLIQKATALRSHQQVLQKQHRQLLLERECMQKLQRLRSSTAREAE